jgi:hypothetical protein
LNFCGCPNCCRRQEGRDEIYYLRNQEGGIFLLSSFLIQIHISFNAKPGFWSNLCKIFAKNYCIDIFFV